MDKEVMISIQGTQFYEDEETVELLTDGMMSGSDGNYRITYLESEMTGLEGTTTTFEVCKNSVILIREGALSSQMVFEEGKKHLSVYDMGFGAMMIGISARHVHTDMNENGGLIEIDYAIEIDNAAAGENSFRVCVRELEGNGMQAGK